MVRVSDLIHRSAKNNVSLDHSGYYTRDGTRGTAVAEVPLLDPKAPTGGGALGFWAFGRTGHEVSNDCGGPLALVQIE